jgi:hypothetical protein
MASLFAIFYERRIHYMTEFQQSYYDWLYDSITSNMNKNYSQLIAKLWDKEFYSLIPNDDNRGEDGRNLRYFYVTEVRGLADADLDELTDLDACRCLEMIVALARRMEDELYGSHYNKTWQDLFWEMMKNLNLLYYNNAHFDATGLSEVDWILENWLGRKYGRDGVGGLFPVARPLRNQAKVEIWYQMMGYMDVNYPI